MFVLYCYCSEFANIEVCIRNFQIFLPIIEDEKTLWVFKTKNGAALWQTSNRKFNRSNMKGRKVTTKKCQISTNNVMIIRRTHYSHVITLGHTIPEIETFAFYEFMIINNIKIIFTAG